MIDKIKEDKIKEEAKHIKCELELLLRMLEDEHTNYVNRCNWIDSETKKRQKRLNELEEELGS